MSRYNKIVFGLIIGVIIIGGIIPFATQFILPFFNPKAFTGGIEVWNQYVSIVLGIVATILSVVSLKMCFSSEESAHQTELRTQNMLNTIDHNLGLLSQKQDFIYNTVSQNNRNTQTNIVNSNNTEWSQITKKSATSLSIDEEV